MADPENGLHYDPGTGEWHVILDGQMQRLADVSSEMATVLTGLTNSYRGQVGEITLDMDTGQWAGAPDDLASQLESAVIGTGAAQQAASRGQYDLSGIFSWWEPGMEDVVFPWTRNTDPTMPPVRGFSPTVFVALLRLYGGAKPLAPGESYATAEEAKAAAARTPGTTWSRDMRTGRYVLVPTEEAAPEGESFATAAEAQVAAARTPGTTWQRDARTGRYVLVPAPVERAPSTPRDPLEALMPKIAQAIDDGDFDTATALYGKGREMMTVPTEREKLQMALDVATAPADYMTLLGMMRGEIPITPLAGGLPRAFQALGPQPAPAKPVQPPAAPPPYIPTPASEAEAGAAEEERRFELRKRAGTTETSPPAAPPPYVSTPVEEAERGAAEEEAGWRPVPVREFGPRPPPEWRALAEAQQNEIRPSPGPTPGSFENPLPFSPGISIEPGKWYRPASPQTEGSTPPTWLETPPSEAEAGAAEQERIWGLSRPREGAVSFQPAASTSQPVREDMRVSAQGGQTVPPSFQPSPQPGSEFDPNARINWIRGGRYVGPPGREREVFGPQTALTTSPAEATRPFAPGTPSYLRQALGADVLSGGEVKPRKQLPEILFGVSPENPFGRFMSAQGWNRMAIPEQQMYTRELALRGISGPWEQEYERQRRAAALVGGGRRARIPFGARY